MRIGETVIVEGDLQGLQGGAKRPVDRRGVRVGTVSAGEGFLS